MPFQKGQSGNPRGRPVAGRAFADALRVAINEAHGEGGTKLRAVAAKLVDEALTGNIAAIREIADRLDGKATQPLEHSGEINTAELTEAEVDARIAQLLAKSTDAELVAIMFEGSDANTH